MFGSVPSAGLLPRCARLGEMVQQFRRAICFNLWTWLITGAHQRARATAARREKERGAMRECSVDGDRAAGPALYVRRDTSVSGYSSGILASLFCLVLAGAHHVFRQRAATRGYAPGDITPPESRCQSTWRQTSDRQSTAVSPSDLSRPRLTVPFYPPLHHNLL